MASASVSDVVVKGMDQQDRQQPPTHSHAQKKAAAAAAGDGESEDGFWMTDCDIDEEDKVLEMHEKFEHINIEWLRVKQCINKRISQKLQLLQALSHLQESLGTVASAAAAAYAAAKFCLEKDDMNLVMDRKELEAKARLQYYQIVKAKRAILKKRKDQGRQVLAADFEEKAAQSTLWQMCVSEMNR